ncbi:uncharacterized protein (TIGR03083 family) [Actinoplanes tereljensis]|uniref:Maleylpyruvate isomerase family mycothiol-dependent enzyme n=1 Tax=Paractinoplanes tereljensis TaxID=571912 RepID=A0A919TVM1_9ACTN|nr:maleylpyruvate isomerase family mycothiol-dependent enzyme [Actinoplanes tereljensis]GIF22087.1 hypothetical protein Ate02nite_48170 [Actinoplanes tereljensis]
MRVDQFVESLRVDGRGLAEAADQAGLDAVVPTCPDWQIRDLLRHTGGVHRWAAAHVTQERVKPFTADEEEQFFAAPDDDALLDWFRHGHQALVGVLSAAEPTVDCWTFLPGAGSPLEFWARRQAHETAVHRADAEAALGRLPQWDPRFAADGINELLRGFFARRPQRLATDPPVSIALCATDAEAAWTIYLGPDGLRVVDADGPATLHLAGTASRLYLLLWNRTGTEGLDAHGDVPVWDAWCSKAAVTWN